MHEVDHLGTSPAAIVAATATSRIRELMEDGETRSREDVLKALPDLERATISKALHGLKIRGEIEASGFDDKGRLLHKAVPGGKAKDEAPHEDPLKSGTGRGEPVPVQSAPYVPKADIPLPPAVHPRGWSLQNRSRVGEFREALVDMVLDAVVKGMGQHPATERLAQAAYRLGDALADMR